MPNEKLKTSKLGFRTLLNIEPLFAQATFQHQQWLHVSLYVDNSCILINRPQPIMLRVLPIMLLSIAQKILPLCIILFLYCFKNFMIIFLNE